MTIDITPIVKAIIEVLIGVVTVLITTKVMPWLNSKLEKSQLELVKDIVKIAVKAAEQLFDKAQGREKLEYAMQFVVSALAERNITIDPEQLRTLIESAVLELHRALETEE